MNPSEKGRIITIINHYFKQFLSRERAIAGNKLYIIPSNAKRCLIKDLIEQELTKADLRFKEEYGLKQLSSEKGMSSEELK